MWRQIKLVHLSVLTTSHHELASNVAEWRKKPQTEQYLFILRKDSESFKSDPVVHINRNCHFVAGDQRTQVFILGTDVSDQTGDSWSIIHVL